MLNPGGKVYRGTVINADRSTGSVVVQLGGFGVADNYVTISTVGRSPVNGRWKVPEVGDQVFVTADDDSLSNPTLLEVWTADPKLMTGDPHGHENRLLSRLAFDNTTRTFTIAPTGGEHIVWCGGQRFSKKLTESVQLPNITNIYFIHYDLNGNLTYKTGVQVNWGVDVPVAYVYWNSSTAEGEFIADERHGITLDWQTHEYLHRTRGAAYASGFGAYGFTTTANGTSATNSDAYLGLYPGTFFDEDLQVDIIHAAAFNLSNPLSWEQYLETPAQIPALYRLSTGWQADPGNDYPLKRGATLPVYNSPATWTNVEIGNNKFGITWVIATNGLNPPILGILGQAEYNTLGEAEAVNWSSLDLTGLPIVEMRPLYKVVYQVGTNYTNTPKAVLRGVYDLRITYSSFGTVPAVQTVDHGALTGLGDDDHTQYLNNTRGDARYLQLTGGSVTGVLYVSGQVTGASAVSAGSLRVFGTSTLSGAVTAASTFGVTGPMTAASTVAVTGVLSSTGGIELPNTTNVGLQNSAGTSYLHLDRTTGGGQWKTKSGATTSIDADTVSVRNSAGTSTFFTASSTGASVANNLNLTVSGSTTSSLVNNAGALEVRGGTNVVLYPSSTGRIATGRGKNTLQMTGFTNLVASTDVTLSNSATDMINGISVTSMEAGDVLDIRAVLRMQRTTVTTSSLTIVVNVAGPSGNTNLPGRLIYADGTTTSDLDHTHSGQWLYTCALGAGTYTVKVYGYGYVASVWKMLTADSDSFLSVVTYSMR